MARNYRQEAGYEDSPAQVRRREARNAARRKGMRQGTVRKGDGKELDHVGYHRTGSLDHVRVVAVTRHANRIRQPPTKARGSARR